VALEEPVKVGVVVSTPNVQLLAKLLKPMAKLSKMYIQDFKDINLALDYLEIEDEHKVDILKNLSELKVKNRL
jgi:hypothetical protein